MRLSALLDALPPHLAPRLSASGDDDPIIRGVTYDSRSVSPGTSSSPCAGRTTTATNT